MSTLRLWRPIAFALLLGAGVVLFYLHFSRAMPGGGDRYEVTAVLPTASTLGERANVTVAGLPVGYVSDVRRARDGVRVTLSLDRDHAPLPADSKFGLRLRTLVGENYVEVVPGRSSEDLPEGGLLPRRSAREYVDVDQILESLRGDTRDRARSFFQGLGGGLDGRAKDLNRTIGEATTFVDEATPVVKVLHDRRQELSRLVDELGAVTGAIGQRGDAVLQFSRLARQTFTAVAERDDALRATLDRLPGAMKQVRRTSGVVRTVSRQTAPVLNETATAVRQVRPTIDALPDATSEGRRVVDELGTAAPLLQPTLRQLERLSGPAMKAIPELKSALCQVNPTLRYLEPYQRELVGVLQGMGSTTNYYDANGHAARLTVNLGANQLRIFDERTSDLLDVLLRNNVVSQFYNVGYNPIPKPGQAGEVADGTQPTGPKDVSQKYKYERVEADC